MEYLQEIMRALIMDVGTCIEGYIEVMFFTRLSKNYSLFQ